MAVCAKAVAVGQPCLTGLSNECESGKCSMGMCAAVKAGDACVGDADCATSRDLYCAKSKCTRAPLPNGSPCPDNTKCASALCLAGTCTAPGKVDAKCGAAGMAPCAANTFCDVPDGKPSGSCTAKKNESESCARDVECASSCGASRGQLRWRQCARGGC